jgi:hypothetical protein
MSRERRAKAAINRSQAAADDEGRIERLPVR